MAHGTVILSVKQCVARARRQFKKHKRVIQLSVISILLLGAVVFAQESLNEGERIHFPIDHVAWILDQETLDALAASPFLRNEFANSGVQKRREGEESGAFFLYGLHTQYLEFRAEVRQTNLDVKSGDAMIAFNAEKEGSVDWIISRMRNKYPESNPSKGLKSLDLGGESVPYSYVATFSYDNGHEGFGAWVMELQRDFKNRMSGGRVKVGDITRHRFGPQVRHQADKYFKDVIEVTVAVSDVRRKDLVNLFSELGYHISQINDKTVCTGKENTIELIPKTNQEYSIVRIKVSLMRPKDGKRTYNFGKNIVLTFGDDTMAVWKFGGVGE